MSLLVYPKSVRGNSISRKSILNMGKWHFLLIIILQACKKGLKLVYELRFRQKHNARKVDLCF